MGVREQKPWLGEEKKLKIGWGNEEMEIRD